MIGKRVHLDLTLYSTEELEALAGMVVSELELRSRTFQCIRCGKVFTVDRGPARFCGDRCRSHYHYHQLSKEQRRVRNRKMTAQRHAREAEAMNQIVAAALSETDGTRP